MHSLRALTWLLVLLVLVPAGVLAWLGFQAADAWDATVEAQMRRNLDEAEVEARRVGARVQREAVQGLEETTAWLAAKVRAELPLSAPGRVFERIVDRSFLMVGGQDGIDPLVGHVVEVRLLDAAGRSLDRTAYRPTDERPAGTDVEALLESLRREADRQQFGDGGTDGAVGVWREVRRRMPGDRLRATCDLEAALVELRAGEGGCGATELARDLDRRWPADVLWRVGRPAVRLWLAAAQEDPGAWGHRLADERLADVPLTEAERASIARIQRSLRDVGEIDVPRDVRFPERILRESPVVDGARLLVAYDLRSFRWGMRDRIRDLGSWGPVRVMGVGGPDGQPHTLVHRASGIEIGRDVLLTDTGDLDVRIHLGHRDALSRIRARDVRRRVTLTGVLSLLALTVVGLVLVRRAVRRERDARQLRDDFIANVSHELRTPLTSVCLHAEMLAEEDPPADRRRELAGVVKAEGRRLAALVDDLLDFAALEQGVRRIEPEPVDLARAVQEAAAPYETLAAREGVELEVEVPEGELVALADAHALSRILANLLSNAWRHGRPSRDGAPGRIRIRAYDEERSTEGPTVEVRDDGPGIPADERGTVFERFHRGRHSRRVEGTGLGLALGRELAHAMAGDLALGEDPKGTVFQLTLPSVPDLES